MFGDKDKAELIHLGAFNSYVVVFVLFVFLFCDLLFEPTSCDILLPIYFQRHAVGHIPPKLPHCHASDKPQHGRKCLLQTDQ